MRSDGSGGIGVPVHNVVRPLQHEESSTETEMASQLPPERNPAAGGTDSGQQDRTPVRATEDTTTPSNLICNDNYGRWKRASKAPSRLLVGNPDDPRFNPTKGRLGKP